MFALRPKLIEHGVWLRPFADVVYIMPPLITSADELQRMIDAVSVTLKDWSTSKA